MYAFIAIIDCGTPPIVTNSVVIHVDGDTEYGATVQYSCNNGYMPIGDSTITCPLNESWPTPSVTCALVDCGDPGTPVNGHANSTTFTYGSSVVYSCDPGYRLHGNESAICQANGQWNASLPTCNIVNCGNPGSPSNGQLNGDNFNYSSIVTYLCDNGFALHGSKTLTCLMNGTWNSSVPICNPINCSDPGVPLNGHRIGQNFSYSSSVMYMCSTGYNLIGQNALTCKGNGSWDGPVPTCETVTCSNPGIPSNGHKIGEVYSYNSSVLFYCNTGYNLMGSNRLTCLVNGSWDANIPICDIVNCSNPGTFNNGQINGLHYTYDSQLTFICKNGYTLQGASSITCLSSGQWSQSVPICVPDCSDPGIPDHGSRSPVVGPYINGTTVSFLCNDGYKLNGESSIMCVSGQWSGNVPQCISELTNVSLFIR